MTWHPLYRRDRPRLNAGALEAMVADANLAGHIASVEEVRRAYEKYEIGAEHWINDTYHVVLRREPWDQDPSVETAHLSIKRHDRAPIHDWRDLQRIKSELLGPECEAVELYPAESRVVDSANQYHLWGFTDPGNRMPFGFLTGLRIGAPSAESNVGQRPFEETRHG